MHSFSRFTTVSYDRRKFHLKRTTNREDRGLVHHKVIDMKLFSFCFIFTSIVIFFIAYMCFFFCRTNKLFHALPHRLILSTIFVPRPSPKAARQAFSYTGAVRWNSLESMLEDEISLNSLKCALSFNRGCP